VVTIIVIQDVDCPLIPPQTFRVGVLSTILSCLANYISEGSVSLINGVWLNSKHLQLVGRVNLYNAHRKQDAHVRKLPYKYPTVWSHFDLFSSLRLLAVLILAVPILIVSNGIPNYC